MIAVRPTPPSDSRLTPLRCIGSDAKYNHVWECICSCGAFTEVLASQLNFGSKKSCGCLSREHTPKLHFLSPKVRYKNRLEKIKYRHALVSIPLSSSLVQATPTLLDEEFDTWCVEEFWRRRPLTTVPWRGWSSFNKPTVSEAKGLPGDPRHHFTEEKQKRIEKQLDTTPSRPPLPHTPSRPPLPHTPSNEGGPCLSCGGPTRILVGTRKKKKDGEVRKVIQVICLSEECGASWRQEK